MARALPTALLATLPVLCHATSAAYFPAATATSALKTRIVPQIYATAMRVLHVIRGVRHAMEPARMTAHHVRRPAHTQIT